MTNSITGRKVAVLSAGAWGVVLASHLSRKGHDVVAFDLPPIIDALKEHSGHPKLPGFSVPDSLRLSSDLQATLIDHEPECVVVTTPSHAIRKVGELCREIIKASEREAPPWIICTKAIEEDSLLTMSDVAGEVWGADFHSKIAVLSGPSFAAEVGVGKPSSVVAAAYDPDLGAYVQSLFMTERFRVYTQDDVLGVELGGSLKNVVAIAAGVCDGMGLGDNARAALITRGLAEMLRLGVAMGARPETFAGLAGMGDLILTCGGTLSRNHLFGELLAKGRSCQEALDEIGMVVEGMRTARSVNALAQRHGVEMPIASEVHAVIYEGKSAREAVHDLMSRDARPERDPA